MDIHTNATQKCLSGDDFMIWMTTRGLNWAQTGRLLGVTAQAVKRYRHTGLNRCQCLALAALEHGLRPWQPSDDDRRIYHDLLAEGRNPLGPRRLPPGPDSQL